jgi:hypothetical protein
MLLTLLKSSVSTHHKAINLAEVSLSTNEDQSFTITSTQLLANAIDVDGDDLSVVSLSVVSSDVDNVTLTDNNNGTWTLTHDKLQVA